MSDGKYAAQVLDAEADSWCDTGLLSDYIKIWDSDPNNDSVRFQLAVLLSKSSDLEHRKQSLNHFEYLSGRPPFVNDSLFHLALTRYYFEDYENARICCEQLYRLEPDNSKVFQLHAAIAYKHSLKLQEKAELEQNAVGITLGLGVAAAVGLGLAMVLNRKK